MRILGIDDVARRAYAAGIIDGEAYLGAKRLMPTAANKMASPKYVISFSLTMADEAPVKAVASLLSLERRIFIRDRKAKAHHSKMFVLDIESQDAVTLLRMVMPYLMAKRRQAELLCEFYEFRKLSRQHRTKAVGGHTFKGGHNLGKPHVVKRLSDSYIKRCDSYYLALRRRFIPNSGGGMARSYR